MNKFDTKAPETQCSDTEIRFTAMRIDELLALESEVFDAMQKRKRNARDAEAAYWAFLHDDDNGER